MDTNRDEQRVLEKRIMKCKRRLDKLTLHPTGRPLSYDIDSELARMLRLTKRLGEILSLVQHGH